MVTHQYAQARIVMNAALVLLALSALAGLAAGFYFSSLIEILGLGSFLAILAATVLHHRLGSLLTIAIIVACLAITQLAYLVGAALKAPPSVALKFTPLADRAASAMVAVLEAVAVAPPSPCTLTVIGKTPSSA